MHTFNYQGHTLTWQEHSWGTHTLIFIHGYAAARSIWHAEVQACADLGRCVTLDLPGHYPATLPTPYGTLSQEELIAIETAAIRAIVGDSTATLIGHSTGGMVALAVAARLPQVTRVVSICGVVWGPLGGRLGFLQRLLRLPGGLATYHALYRSYQRSRSWTEYAIPDAYVYDRGAFAHNPYARAAIERWIPDFEGARVEPYGVLLRLLEISGTVRGCPVFAPIVVNSKVG
jgi:pimeloyl-ACP methyl ester carboxylesterase